jgi:hypothetical protein
MIYKTASGRAVEIPALEIKNLMSSLDLSETDAIDLWLCDNGYEEDEEQTKLDEKASKVKISHEIDAKKPKKERKKPEKKVSDAKKELFSEILSNLQDVYKENVEVLTENKLISVKIGETRFKIDVIQQRPPKK